MFFACRVGGVCNASRCELEWKQVCSYAHLTAVYNDSTSHLPQQMQLLFHSSQSCTGLTRRRNVSWIYSAIESLILRCFSMRLSSKYSLTSESSHHSSLSSSVTCSVYGWHSSRRTVRMRGSDSRRVRIPPLHRKLRELSHTDTAAAYRRTALSAAQP